jgi:hypothetical protein
VRRFAAWFALVSFILAGSSEPLRAKATSLDGLLAAINHASGAPYRFHLRSSETASSSGRSLAVVINEQGPAYFRKRCDRELCAGLYFDGKRDYLVDANQTALPESGNDGSRATLRAIESYAFTDPGFTTAGGRVSDRGRVLGSTRSVDDEGRRHLVVAAPLGVPMDVAIDADTSLIANATSLDGNTRFTFADERRVDDQVTLPFAIDLNQEPLDRFDRRSIVEQPFEPPAGLVPHFAASGAAVKLTGARAGDPPVTACTIGGVTAACLLDTGNSGMSMSLELAEQLNLEPMSAPFEVTGIGSYATGLVRAPGIEIGAASYPPATYVILHDIHRYGYDLILGADFFAHTRVTLDYPHRALTLAPQTAAGDPASIPINFVNFIPVVAVQMGAADAHLALDTGDDSTINLAEQYYRAHPALFRPTGTSPVSGVGGKSQEILGQIAAISVGQFTIEHQRIGATEGLNPTGDGHLGCGFLEHFAVTFDYQHEHVSLTPRPGDAAIKPR